MNRLRPVLVALIVGAIAMTFVAACSVASPPALTVGTFTLSRKDFLADLDTLTKAGIIKPVANPNQSQTTDTTPTAYSPSTSAQVLNAFTQYQLRLQLLQSKGVSVTDADTQAGKATIAQQMAQSSQTGQTPTADDVDTTLSKYGPLKDVLIGQAAAGVALGRVLVTDEEVAKQGQTLYDQQKTTLAQTCVNLLVNAAGGASAAQSGATPTDADFAAALAKSQAAKAKIDAGQSFADVAKTDSDEPDAATEQCVTAANLQNAPPELVTAINATATGKVSDPTKVTSLPGYLLINVTQRKTPTYEESKAQIEPNVRTQIASDRITGAVTTFSATITISVDPLFGTWDKGLQQVVAPAGASEPSVASTQPNLLDPTASTAAPTTTAPLNCTPTTITPPAATDKPTVAAVSGPAPTTLDVKTLTEGTGPAAQKGDKVSVQYVGALAKDGTEFDSSWSRNADPLSFTLGNDEVVPGFDQGVIGMKVGSRAQLTIPADLAYGAQGKGSIGPNEALVFVVDLVQVCSPDAPAAAASASPAAGGDIPESTTVTTAAAGASAASSTTTATVAAPTTSRVG